MRENVSVFFSVHGVFAKFYEYRCLHNLSYN